MFLEQLWPHLPTPIVNLVVLIEAAIVYLYSNDYGVLSLTFIAILTLAFILGSVKGTQPFHIERIAVIITLAFINVAVLAQHMGEFNEALHLHSSQSIMVVRIGYAAIWCILLIIAILGYFYNAGQQVTRAWPLLVIVTLLAILIPLEPDSFVMNQPLWLWITRVLIALILFTLVTVGDTTNVTIRAYYSKLAVSAVQGGGHSPTLNRLNPPTAQDVDLPLARTLIWLPITLWVMFVPKALVFVAIAIIVLIARSVVERWRRVADVHQHYMTNTSLIQRALHVVGIDRIMTTIEDIENQALAMVRTHLEDEQKRRLHESKKHKRKSSFSEQDIEQLVIDLREVTTESVATDGLTKKPRNTKTVDHW